MASKLQRRGQYVDQLYMYIAMPDDAYLTSRDMAEDAPILVYYGTTKDEFSGRTGSKKCLS